jgi:hypothetical protein
MKIIGLRFSNKEYAYAVVEGSRTHPVLLASSIVRCPKNFKACEIARWTKHELDELFGQHEPNYVALKAFEGRSKGAAYEERVRLEGIAHLCASELGLKDIGRKRNPTIAKDLGLKGRARYLKTLDTSPFAGFETLEDHVAEAALVAWSSLRN